MPAALVGASTCHRCGTTVRTDRTCAGCAAAYVPAALPAVTTDSSPLAGVVRAGIGRRYGAHVIDLAVLAGVVLAVWRGLPTSWSPAVVITVAALAGLLVLVVQAWVLADRGRSVGRALLRLRTVDDLTGTPVRGGRFLHQVGTAGGLRRFVTADLRRGRDPLEPQLGAPPLVSSVLGRTPDAGPAAVAAGDGGADTPARTVALTHEARPSVGIELDSGERYEIHHALLIGRSPQDPDGRGDRALLAWPDLSRRLAKTHVLLEWSTTVLWVTDLSSATGTAIVGVDGSRSPLVPGVRAGAVVGAVIECGGRSITVVQGG